MSAPYCPPGTCEICDEIYKREEDEQAAKDAVVEAACAYVEDDDMHHNSLADWRTLKQTVAALRRLQGWKP